MKNHTSQKINKLKLGVIGDPISHSKSPLIHNFFIEKFSLNAIYTAINIKNHIELDDFFNQFKDKEWCGINVTIPYKEAVIPYLNSTERCVEIIGACNTIVNKNGRCVGFNTDAEGFYMPLKNKKIENAIVLGNGGAAKAVLYQCAKEGITDITLVARNKIKSDDCVKRLNDTFNSKIKTIPFNMFSESLVKNYKLIVNTTSVGMNQDDDSFPAINAISRGQFFYDLIYSPWETKMIKIAKANNASVINGAMMLAGQAALAFELFFNLKADEEKMFSLLKQELDN